jgi:hypothetical protein
MTDYHINGQEPALAQVHLALFGGKYLLRIIDPANPTYGEILSPAGTVIGMATRSCYGLRGWAVHTKAFGGFVPNEQIVLVTDTP